MAVMQKLAVPNLTGLTSEHLELVDVSKRFGSITAVNDVSLDIREGEFFSFLGPSGCGKTTILRLISGFTDPTSGEIRLGGRSLVGMPPNKRPTALIFQNLALFPLMSVSENIAYGLKIRRATVREQQRKVNELLELIDLNGYGSKSIDELSGGQKQRVAIARALAVSPSVLLLDEPLSALDLKLRQHMRSELRKTQRRTGITFVYITHDQSEALAMSDRVAVMSQGKIEQVGRGADIYNEPATAFVASFVGENNIIPGEVVRADSSYAQIETRFGRLRGRNPRNLEVGADALLFVRPESLRVSDDATAGENRLSSQISEVIFDGSVLSVILSNASAKPIMMSLMNDCPDRQFEPSRPIAVSFRPDTAVCLPAGPIAVQEMA